MQEIIFDSRYGTLTPEIEAKILKSREEVENMTLRMVECPICHFPAIGAYSHTGYVNIKCRKCKFTGPLNLAYFRRMKQYYSYNPYSYRKTRQER